MVPLIVLSLFWVLLSGIAFAESVDAQRETELAQAQAVVDFLTESLPRQAYYWDMLECDQPDGMPMACYFARDTDELIVAVHERVQDPYFEAFSGWMLENESPVDLRALVSVRTGSESHLFFVIIHETPVEQYLTPVLQVTYAGTREP